MRCFAVNDLSQGGQRAKTLSMKKLYLFAAIGLLVMLFTSCTKEYIAPESTSKTILLSIPAEGWQSADGINYRATLSVPELSTYLSETGQVLTYLSFDGGPYEQIPEVRDDISYSFSNAPGVVTIYAQDLNGSGIIPPSNTDVKIVLVPAGY